MKLEEWLKSLRDIFDVKSGTLTLDGVEYEAAYYKRETEAPQGASNPGKSIDEYIYVIGTRPKKTMKNRWAFKMKDDVRDWYIATYMNPDDYKKLDAEKKKFHPFGVSFIISPWDLPEPIDKYENYNRLQAEFNSELKTVEI